MKISEMYSGGAFLKASDLRGRVSVQIARLAIEDFGGESKPVVYFVGKEKGLVLNKTNGNTIAAICGDETDSWPGNNIVLFPTTTDFQGSRVPCIRVEASVVKQQQPAVQQQEVIDDDTPF